MTLYDEILILRIAGAGDTSGQYAFTTRALPYAVTGTEFAGALAGIPNVLQHRVSLLDPVGTVSGVGVSLVYDPIGVASLLDSQIASITDSGTPGTPCRLIEPVADAAVGSTANLLFNVQPDLTAGDLFWIHGEAFEYDSYSAGRVVCTRGQLGTRAAAHAYTDLGALVMGRWPTVIGARCTISRVSVGAASEAAEEVIYRGVIGSVEVDGGRVQLQIGSALQALRDAPYVLPSNDAGLDGVTFGRGGAQSTAGIPLALTGATEIKIQFGAAGMSTADVTHAWLALEGNEGGGKARALVTVDGYTEAITDGNGNVLGRVWGARIDDSQVVEQFWIEDHLVTAQEAIAAMGLGWKVTRASIADVIATSSPADFITELLTGGTPTTARGGLSSSEVDVDSLDVMTRAVQVSELGLDNLYSGATGIVMPYKERAVRMREVLAEVLGAVGVSIAPSRDGVVRAIDWASTTRGATAITKDSLRGALTGWTLDDSTAIREVTLRTQVFRSDVAKRYVSDLATNVHAGGRVLDVDASVWGYKDYQFDGVGGRWSSLLAAWQRGAPVFAFGYARSAALEVGQVVSMAIDSLMGWDGARYSATTAQMIHAVVIGVAPRIDSPVDEVTAIAIGWGTTRKDGVWGPAAEVQSYAAGVVTVDDTFTADDDAAAFTVGTRVYLLDSTGARRDSGTPPQITAIGSTALTVTFSVTPNAGDIIVPSDVDDASAAQPLALSAEFGFARRGETFWADAGDTVQPAAGHYTYA